MDPNDKEWMEQLARDPFGRSGFDERLRQRIEERLGREQQRVRRPWKHLWRMPAAVLASLVILLAGFWLWRGQIGDGQSAKDADTLMSRESSASSSEHLAGQPKKYALLIGLRTDEMDRTKKGTIFPTSSYRTLLVAPENQPDDLRLITDNQGLYVPHQQDFWQIAAVPESGGRQVLRAVKKTNGKNLVLKDILAPANLMSERVLFAGNQYLSVSSTLSDGKGGQIENLWVKTIDTIDTKSPDPNTEPHVRLEGVLPDQVAHPPVEQWAIVRNPGRWMADVPDLLSQGLDPNHFPAALPQQVVNRDSLSMSWAEIVKLEPAATDAFTYGNVLGVVADGEIRVHVVRDGKDLPSSAAIPLRKGESIVMIQWAQDGYVDKWINEMRSLSGK